jgi:hypothetical protein
MYAWFLGRAWVRFEMIPAFARRREAGGNLVVRVLEFITPPNTHDKVFQEQGELLKWFEPGCGKEYPLIVHAKGAKQNHSLLTPSSLKTLRDAYLPKERNRML